jgi:hypothetical protein
MSFSRPLESLIGMFQRLLGMLVSGLVIFFSVVRRGSTVRVCGEFMEFGSSLVRVIWHSASPPRFPLHLRTIPLSILFNYEHSPRGQPVMKILSNIRVCLPRCATVRHAVKRACSDNAARGVAKMALELAGSKYSSSGVGNLRPVGGILFFP